MAAREEGEQRPPNPANLIITWTREKHEPKKQPSSGGDEQSKK